MRYAVKWHTICLALPSQKLILAPSAQIQQWPSEQLHMPGWLRRPHHESLSLSLLRCGEGVVGSSRPSWYFPASLQGPAPGACVSPAAGPLPAGRVALRSIAHGAAAPTSFVWQKKASRLSFITALISVKKSEGGFPARLSSS